MNKIKQNAIEVTQNVTLSDDVVLANGSNEVIDIFKALINSGARHKHYRRVVEKAKKNTILATGENIKELLQQFSPRESEEAFNQRVKFTKAVTPAVYNSLKKPFNKAGRNGNIKINIDLKQDHYNTIIEKMRESFYSNHKHSKSQGLDYWLKDEFLNISFVDPNAWLVIEWGSAELNEVVKPVPFVVRSKNALNYNYKDNELEWLFVDRSIQYNAYDKSTNKIVMREGVKYVYYTNGKTLTATQCCKNYLAKTGTEAVTWESKTKDLFIIDEFETKLDFVPAFRLGYVKDLATNRETYVSPFEPAMCYFDKSIKLGSEFDLATMLHAFPQKTELREICHGTPIQKCDKGKVRGTSDDCRVCNGTGFNSIVSAQDVRVIQMPKDWEDMKHIDLSKLTHYDAPPVELLEFQNKLIDNLKLDSHLAVFSSTIYASKEISGPKTATEVEGDFDGIYDALEPFTEKISELFKDVITVFFHIAGVPETIINDATLIHKFPEDLKLKTVGYLLNELKKATDADAPSFFISDLTNDLANIVYADAPIERIKYKVKERFYPFNGKSKEEIQMLVMSNYISEQDKILYANFENIFREIEIENPKFFLMTANQFSQQWDIVKKKIDEFKTTIDESKPNFNLSFEGINPNIDDEEEEEEVNE